MKESIEIPFGASDSELQEFEMTIPEGMTARIKDGKIIFKKMVQDYVDLGLPSGTKWATCNVGTDSPEEYGDYLSFDEAIGLKNIEVPTKEQWEELMDKCEWEWTENGYNVIGPNKNSIFLPAAGYRGGTNLSTAGPFGYYWSSSLYTDYPGYARYVGFDPCDVFWCHFDRCGGHSVRPVTK